MESNLYEVSVCPICGESMWNGRCENPDCYFHWHPYEENEKEDQHG